MINFIIILNKNKHNLNLLIKSLIEKVTGDYRYHLIDMIENKSSNSGFLQKRIIEIIQENPNELYTIIDENKFVYDSFDVSDIIKTLKDPEIFCFSLNLGENITFCANMNCENVFKPDKIDNNILYWNWSKHYFDFGYPFNLDGTVFRGKELIKFIKNISFEDTLQLETGLQIFDNYPKEIMCAFLESKIIEIIFENPENSINFNRNGIKIDKMKFFIQDNPEPLKMEENIKK